MKLGVLTADYPQHNTNYRALISKYVGGGAGGGEARTATDVLAADKERKSRTGKESGKIGRERETESAVSSPSPRNKFNQALLRETGFLPTSTVSLHVGSAHP